MCRYKKWEVITEHRFTAEGNHGGDYIEISDIDADGISLPEGMVRLEIGSCCVVTIKALVPVELITVLLTQATDYGNLEGSIEKAWQGDYGKQLAGKIVRL